VFADDFPPVFRMASPISPIPRSTVIWFGSLEFMSTGFGYDMILLSIRGPEGARIVPARSRATRRPHHHASPPKRRDQHRQRRPMATVRSPPRAGQLDLLVEGPSAPRLRAVTEPASQGSDRCSAAQRETIPRAPSPPSAVLPHGLFATR